MVTVTINHRDEDDIVVDTETVEMTEECASNIIDAAAEVVLRLGDKGAGNDPDVQMLKDYLVIGGVL